MKKIYILGFLIIASLFFLLSQRVLSVKSIENNSQAVNEENKEEYVPSKILFVGDMMFDRGVESIMKDFGFDYPVDMIKDFASKFDYLVGNLEGPINEKPKEFTDESMKFSFDKGILESLKTANFKVLSLANNHTLNMGEDGLEETKSILTEASINFVGDPIECDADYIFQKDGVTFYSVNTTFPMNCSDSDITDWIEATKFYNPESIFVVLMHWGEEYKNKSSKTEQDLAHKMIDAGADIVIGGHPHVAQEIEIYNNHLIFYSLGNFIFDQYFSKETQEGLAVGLEIYPDKKVFNLYPIKNRVSQPRLMDGEEKQAFLDNLANNSSESIRESIIQGKIEIKI
ncbi:MAG: CapA family protein [Candidatus Pacebacteria bacterium]|nr:CapA family protein [Candidatus Paceibacterota bacterium]